MVPGYGPPTMVPGYGTPTMVPGYTPTMVPGYTTLYIHHPVPPWVYLPYHPVYMPSVLRCVHSRGVCAEAPGLSSEINMGDMAPCASKPLFPVRYSMG